jgi:hypothetical protein
MSNKIPVTYDSRAGSTRGVAEAIDHTIMDSGAQVEVRLRQDVTDLTPDRVMIAGSAAALIAGVVFLLAVIDLIIPSFRLGTPNGWVSLFQNNWLMVIFKLHAGFSGVQIELLHILNFLDIAILALVGTMYLGLYAALRRTSRIWSITALALPFLGIVLFIATNSAGRSAVMGAGLIISVVMLRNNIFNRATAYMGILASALLLVGDFSAGVLHSNIITTLCGIGYVLLMTWFFLISRRLFQLGLGVLPQAANRN